MSGLCECGCGQATTIAPQNHTARGYVKGEPLRFVLGHHRRKPERWRVVDCGFETPCHVWALTLSREGYGWDHVDGRKVPAHRAAWERERGPISAGLVIDHLCRNRACVNVEHLEPVTKAEDNRRRPYTKLTAETAAAIRTRSAQGESLRRLALAYGVSPRTIAFIRDGTTWKAAA